MNVLTCETECVCVCYVCVHVRVNTIKKIQDKMATKIMITSSKHNCILILVFNIFYFSK